MSDYTRRFDLPADDTVDTREILSQVYNSLQQKGYNPINQIVGYILSEDPTYITNFNNARTLIRKLDRDELLQELVRYYLDVWSSPWTALFDCPGKILRPVSRAFFRARPAPAQAPLVGQISHPTLLLTS